MNASGATTQRSLTISLILLVIATGTFVYFVVCLGHNKGEMSFVPFTAFLAALGRIVAGHADHAAADGLGVLGFGTPSVISAVLPHSQHSVRTLLWRVFSAPLRGHARQVDCGCSGSQGERGASWISRGNFE